MEIYNNQGNIRIVIPVVIAALIVLIIIGYYYYQPSPTTQSNQSSQTVQSSTTPGLNQYKNGTYSATGNYVSPGGSRDVDVTITIQDGKITKSEFVGKATDPTSKRFQTEFADNYKTLVVGKNIDEVMLTKVSGSSLTPKGFDDALAKIKTQAKS